VIVQADGLGTGLAQTLVAMIASNMARAGHPARVIARVGSGSAKGSGLLTDSVIMADNLATIQYSEIDRVIGSLSAIDEVDAALRATLAL
jgi:mRNA interferase MazF